MPLRFWEKYKTNNCKIKNVFLSIKYHINMPNCGLCMFLNRSLLYWLPLPPSGVICFSVYLGPAHYKFWPHPFIFLIS
jgi:hypothetical protein